MAAVSDASAGLVTRMREAISSRGSKRRVANDDDA
jgi:hypothetical protein